jgi:hypothetical protein
LLTLESVLKILCRNSAKFLATGFHGTSYVLILTKNGWASLWATFSKTHLVTLAVRLICMDTFCSLQPARNEET